MAEWRDGNFSGQVARVGQIQYNAMSLLISSYHICNVIKRKKIENSIQELLS
jgi:hypothetical protein